MALAADGAVPWPGNDGASWSPTPLPASVDGPADEVARRFDAVSVTDHGDHAELHGGISGAVPMYIDHTHDDGVSFSSSVQPLLATRRSISPDWDVWAQMLAAGAPLGGTTTVAGISRLRPWERVRVGADGTVATRADSWPWLDLTPGPAPSTEAIAEALEAAVQEVAAHTPLAPLLSGEWKPVDDSSIRPAAPDATCCHVRAPGPSPYGFCKVIRHHPPPRATPGMAGALRK